MVVERYPADTTIAKSDFDKEDCQKILDESSGDGYPSMYDAFSIAARRSIESQNPKQAKIYWLLADTCSMVLSPNDRNDPFKPFAVFSGRRSAIADDFSSDEMHFLSDIMEEVTDNRLKARLADLAWTRASKKDVKNALIAIDAYRQIPLDTETWVRDGRECWYRAISLAIMLRGGAGNRVREMEEEILKATASSTKDDGYLALWLAECMEHFGLGKGNASEIASKLESLAKEYELAANLPMARDYFETSAKWHELTGNESKSVEMVVCKAEAFVKEAIANSTAEQPGHLAAASLYEKAIQILRTIPRPERAAMKIDERISELYRCLNEESHLSPAEMKSVSSDGIDVTKLIEGSRASVSGKTPTDALKAFTRLSKTMSFSEMRESARDSVRQHPFSSLFAKTYISRDGRVIAKTGGSGTKETDDDHVYATVMRNHGINVTLVAQAAILPALEILHSEHRIREFDFLTIVKQSPIVPLGREILFAKGLYAGYERDYVVALHLLVPQIEHMVRYHLKNAGIKTSNLDGLGIENENGLSTLIDLPEMNDVFGEDLTFEIKALFCDSLGANLRNELAHGLVDHNACNSLHGVYAWWLSLRLVCLGFWNSARQEQDSEDMKVEK